MPFNLRTATYGPIGVVALVLGVSASQAHDGRPERHHGPRLVATPAHLTDARNLAPGDRVERLVELRLRGRGGFAAVFLRVRAPESSLLDADARQGLRVAIDRCSASWRGRGGRYFCAGRRFTVLARRPLVGRVRLSRLGLLRSRVAHLRLVLALPSDAANALQAQVTKATYSFVGAQRR
jgi:hypothetical protein